jgi:hypothetical protein
MSDATSAYVDRDEPIGFRARLKFKLATLLSVENRSIEIQVSGRAVVIAPAYGEGPKKDAEWIMMTAAGFAERRRVSVRSTPLTQCTNCRCTASNWRSR